MLASATWPSAQEPTVPYRTPAPPAEPPDPQPTTPAEDPPDTARARIGRYAILHCLGAGGFGTVYLAHDAELNRPVAIKVPLADRLGSERAIHSALKEAQIAAGLRHPGIVTVHDFGRLPDGGCYFVMEYVAGRSLAQVLKEGPLTHAQIAGLVLELAEALHHAHQRGLVHRDLKPANVLLDPAGHPHVTDFGLAVQGHSQHLLAGEVAGTPVYMAPEQVRGESHRLDGRTDLWSLGVILYELLTGRRPFVGREEELFDQILSREPRPPRQINPSVPRELERICLKCLSKRMSDRYPAAADLADDLRSWRDAQAGAPPAGTAPANGAPPAPPSGAAVRVVPKGLRAFDARDADFFLHLLPGPRDRHGLPDSLVFWKARLEATDPDTTFSVGLLYGPSGCGKTSLVLAGLLPRLAAHVSPVYLEATPHDTEARLVRALYKHCPPLPEGLGLVKAVASLRGGTGLAPGGKVVVVLDQFEQWLHANRDPHDGELVHALRQCDGEHVQCVLLVRDDFWMAVSSFLRDLEVPILEGQNSAAVDLFGARHARRVLADFGRAFGCLPDDPAGMTPDHQQFLDRAVEELARDGKVVPVRLSLFTEMVKDRPWAPATLRSLGGTKGLGVAFLEETFDLPTAPPEHRRHASAARAVLNALLPDNSADIKGALRSRDELLAASGYGQRPRDFDELLHVLDGELRLVTPADPEGAAPAEGPGPPGRYYQLTHDYLVPSLREWLTRKQKETWRGRAELTLRERAAQWGRSRDRRFLPSLGEYLAARLAVPRGRRTPVQQDLLRTAGRHHALRWGALLAAGVLLAVLLQQYVSSVRYSSRRQRAEALVDAALRAPPEGVPYLVEDLRPLRDVAVPLLRERFRDDALGPRIRLHAAVALADFGQVEEDFLLDSLRTAPASESQNVLKALRPAGDTVPGKLRERLRHETDLAVRVRLAATLLHLGEAGAAREFLAFGPDPSRRTAFIHGFDSWRGDLAGLPEVLRATDDPALRSGLCMALGMIGPDRLGAAPQERLQEVLLELYRQAPDGATHSAAGWALARWKVRLPEFPRAARAEGRRWFVTPSGLTMLAIPPGTFVMGEPGDPKARAHPVTLTRGFFLCDREVSFELFGRFMADPDPAVERPARWAPNREYCPTPDCPALQLTWEDAVRFCNWLSRREGRRPCYARGAKAAPAGGKKEVAGWECDFAADGYRLPTEAEWEYACRAGTTTAYSFGDDVRLLPHYAVFALHDFAAGSPRPPRNRGAAAPGGSKLPNDWGLFDMHGNAREWCWDQFLRDYPRRRVADPRGGDTGLDRMHRGGSWYDYPDACRSAFRNRNHLTHRDDLLGFRVCFTAPAPGAAR